VQECHAGGGKEHCDNGYRVQRVNYVRILRKKAKKICSPRKVKRRRLRGGGRKLKRGGAGINGGSEGIATHRTD